MSYDLIVAGFFQTFLLKKDSLWRVVFRTIHYKTNVIYKKNASMGILKALYLLPSGRLGTTGEIVADGGEVEMFSPTLESTSCCA